MKLLIQQRLYREIENQFGCSRRAGSRANTVLCTQGFTTVEQVEDLTVEELDACSSTVAVAGRVISSRLILMWWSKHTLDATR